MRKPTLPAPLSGETTAPSLANGKAPSPAGLDVRLKLPPPTAVYAFTPQGLAVAARIARNAKIRVHAPASLQRPSETKTGLPDSILFFDSLPEIIGSTFKAYSCHIFISAAAIAVRAIAPHLVSKTQDPAVLVVDQQARHVISLVSGHLGGANGYAAELASLLGATPVISTATDLEGLPAIDLLAKEQGLAIANPAMIKSVSAALLRGETVKLYDPEGYLRLSDDAAPFFVREPHSPGNSRKHREATANRPDVPGDPCVVVSEYLLPADGLASCLALHPVNLCVGIGCKKGVDAGVILGLVRDTFACERLPLCSIRYLASIDAKQEETGLRDTAAALGIPILFFSPEELSRQPSPSPSPKAKEIFGVAGVCEPAALAAAQGISSPPNLIVGKCKRDGVTVAVARPAGIRRFCTFLS